MSEKRKEEREHGLNYLKTWIRNKTLFHLFLYVIENSIIMSRQRPKSFGLLGPQFEYVKTNPMRYRKT